MRCKVIEQDNTRERVERAVAGDRTAFDCLCREFQGPVLGTIRQMIGRSAGEKVDPDDVLQDVLTSAWNSLAEFDWHGPQSFRRWLEGIARHRVLHLSRRELRRAELLELQRPERDQDSPSHGVRRTERFERLKSAVGSLRPEYREVIRLARLEGHSIREIASLLGKTESAVKNLLLRAMKSLRDVMPETESLTLPKDRWIGEHIEGETDKGSEDDGP